jgi:hypothetical protein
MTVIGRLGVAPEEVTVSGDRTLVRYVVGTSYGKGDDKKTSWFRIASFVQGAQKDFLMNVPKGSLLYVDADARMETYLDSEGNKKSNLSLVARMFSRIGYIIEAALIFIQATSTSCLALVPRRPRLTMRVLFRRLLARQTVLPASSTCFGHNAPQLHFFSIRSSVIEEIRLCAAL